MSRRTVSQTLQYLPHFTTGKVIALPTGVSRDVPDSLASWAARYLTLAVIGVRSPAVTNIAGFRCGRCCAFATNWRDRARRRHIAHGKPEGLSNSDG